MPQKPNKWFVYSNFNKNLIFVEEAQYIPDSEPDPAGGPRGMFWESLETKRAMSEYSYWPTIASGETKEEAIKNAFVELDERIKIIEDDLSCCVSMNTQLRKIDNNEVEDKEKMLEKALKQLPIWDFEPQNAIEMTLKVAPTFVYEPEDTSEIKNAIIRAVDLTTENGFLETWLTVEYGDDTIQKFGGTVLYLPEGYKNHDINSPAGHAIHRIMSIADVSDWNEIVGKSVRVTIEDNVIKAIGHITKDIWYDPSKDLK